MKSQALFSLLALVGSGVTAPNRRHFGPFGLKITGASNSTLKNTRLYACHAGIFVHGLCVTPPGVKFASPFYLNSWGAQINTADGYRSSPEAGSLIYNASLPDNGSVSTRMNFNYFTGTNVAVPTFMPRSGGTPVGFDKAGKMFVSSDDDDSKFGARSQPNDTHVKYLYHWHACWNFVQPYYYYHTVSWVTSGKPHNPTCEPVNVTRVNIYDREEGFVHERQ